MPHATTDGCPKVCPPRFANETWRWLRNNIGDVLRRAEAGEEFTITVSGRPGPRLRAIWATPAPTTLAQDLERLPGELVDPFA